MPQSEEVQSAEVVVSFPTKKRLLEDADELEKKTAPKRSCK